MSLVERECRFRKADGRVRVTAQHVLWHPSREADGVNAVRIPVGSICSQMVSAAGSKSALIKLATVDAPKGVIFDFGPTGFLSRDAVKDVITPLIAASGIAATAAATAASPALPMPSAEPDTDAPQTSTNSKAAQIASATAPEPGVAGRGLLDSSSEADIPEKLTPEEIKRRVELLKTNEEIRNLHELLVSKARAVSDRDFWKGIAFRLKDASGDQASVEKEKALPVDKPGVPTALLTELKGSDTGQSAQVFRFTPAIIHQIFVEHPEVHRAHRALVPYKMTDEKFWKRYVESRVLGQGQTKARGDRSDMFAKYELEAEKETTDDLKQRVGTLESRELQLDRRDDYKSIHNAGTHCSDDGSSLNAMAVSSKKNKFLPLVRRYNRHGGLVLDSSAAHNPAGQRAEAANLCWRESEHRKLHSLADLEEEEALDYIPLKIRDVSVFVDSGSSSNHADSSNALKRRREAVSRVHHDWNEYAPDLSRYCSTRAPAGAKENLENFFYDLYNDRL
mmetsp:Transcript_1864/g.4926  ORF Transcript_1864/g.4926 Transcript_1864/m.4926 type:complete len:508 (-) Transcript_1864:430-1953(-)